MNAEIPLSEVPVGRYVVYEGKVLARRGATHCNLHEEGAALCHLIDPDTPVLLLDGTEPRPLRECEGRDVWHPERGVGKWDSTFVWRVGLSRWPDGAFRWSGHGPSAIDGAQSDDLCWPLATVEDTAEPQPRWTWCDGTPENNPGIYHDGEMAFYVEPMRDGDGPTLAAHLNATTPEGLPEPEPERPATWQEAVAEVLPQEEPQWLLAAIDDVLMAHGYHVVDVTALTDIIDRLREVANGGFMPASHAATLLDHLGVRDA